MGGGVTEYNAAGLKPGYLHRKRGAASYGGVLRTEDTRTQVWECKHDHFTAMAARRCAEGELDRRREGAKNVLTLLHCQEEGIWYDPAVDGAAVDWRPGLCPRCGVPMLREKVMILQAEDARDDPDANLTWAN